MSVNPLPLSLDAPADWRGDAACSDVDVDLFFAVDDATQHEAVAICESCPVRAECLEWALSTKEPHGVWGGCAEGERKQMLLGKVKIPA